MWQTFSTQSMTKLLLIQMCISKAQIWVVQWRADNRFLALKEKEHFMHKINLNKMS